MWNQVSSVTKVLIGFSVSPKRFLEATVPCRLSDLARKGWRTQVVTRALMLAAEMVQGTRCKGGEIQLVSRFPAQVVEQRCYVWFEVRSRSSARRYQISMHGNNTWDCGMRNLHKKLTSWFTTLELARIVYRQDSMDLSSLLPKNSRRSSRKNERYWCVCSMQFSNTDFRYGTSLAQAQVRRLAAVACCRVCRSVPASVSVCLYACVPACTSI